MKKKVLIPILVLILLLSLSGCKKDPVVEKGLENPAIGDEGDKKAPAEDEIKIVMDEFSTLTKDYKEPLEIKSFIDKNIDKVSQLEGNEMLNTLESSLMDNLEIYTEKILDYDKDGELIKLEGNKLIFPKDRIKDIKEEKLRKEVEKLYDSMYKLVNKEGVFYPFIDYSQLQEYNTHISDDWKEYLAIQAMDSNEPAMADGELTIDFKELADRILKTENYLNRYIDSPRYEDMLIMYEHKISIYLKGLPNTPIADPSNKKIYDKVWDSYIETSHMEGYVTGDILYKYSEAIKSNDYIIDKKILEKAEELITEGMDILREFK